MAQSTHQAAEAGGNGLPVWHFELKPGGIIFDENTNPAQYFCFILYPRRPRSAGGEVTAETLLSVHAPPKVSVRTPGRVFLPRQQVVITCQAYGQPHPDIVWTRGFDDVIVS